MNEFNLIVEALNKATTKGVFNLQETEAILKAIVAVQEKIKEAENREKEKK